jgi:hypothetical protein
MQGGKGNEIIHAEEGSQLLQSQQVHEKEGNKLLHPQQAYEMPRNTAPVELPASSYHLP